MTKYLGFLGCLVAAAVGCKKFDGKAPGGADKYAHDNPHFTVTRPGDLVVGADKTEDSTHNLSIATADGSRELFFVWAPIGSPGDPIAIFGNYGKEPDNTKIVEQGELPPNGKFVVNLRGSRTFIHKVITTGDGKWGVLCMASTNDPVKDADLIEGCKSLNIN
jgi:hypothetical protein